MKPKKTTCGKQRNYMCTIPGGDMSIILKLLRMPGLTIAHMQLEDYEKGDPHWQVFLQMDNNYPPPKLQISERRRGSLFSLRRGSIKLLYQVSIMFGGEGPLALSKLMDPSHRYQIEPGVGGVQLAFRGGGGSNILATP